MTGSKVVKLAGCLNNLFNSGIAKLNNIARIHVDQVIVLHAVIRFLELGYVLSELVFNYQAAIKQQLYGVIKRSSADPVVFILHKNI